MIACPNTKAICLENKFEIFQPSNCKFEFSVMVCATYFSLVTYLPGLLMHDIVSFFESEKRIKQSISVSAKFL